MSVQALSSAFAIKGLTPSEKLVLLALANYADPQMRAFPSHSTLADDTGLSERTILTVMRGLSERGVISRQERRRPDGSRASDLITLNIGGATISPGGENERQTKPQMTVGGGEMVSPLTTFEPSTNRQIEEPILAAQAPTTSKRGSKRCPDAWAPSKSDIAAGEAEGFSPGEIERELAKFRDHTFATARSDWGATFRNWLRTASDRRPRNDQPRESRKSVRDEKLGRMLAGAMAAADG